MKSANLMSASAKPGYQLALINACQKTLLTCYVILRITAVGLRYSQQPCRLCVPENKNPTSKGDSAYKV